MGKGRVNSGGPTHVRRVADSDKPQAPVLTKDVETEPLFHEDSLVIATGCLCPVSDSVPCPCRAHCHLRPRTASAPQVPRPGALWQRPHTAQGRCGGPPEVLPLLPFSVTSPLSQARGHGSESPDASGLSAGGMPSGPVSRFVTAVPHPARPPLRCHVHKGLRPNWQVFVPLHEHRSEGKPVSWFPQPPLRVYSVQAPSLG